MSAIGDSTFRTDADAARRRQYRVVAGLLIAWVFFLMVTHLGPASPYTVAGEKGWVAHPDARTVAPVTRFFYDGAPPHYAMAHNLKLPLHSFMVATVGAFVRPYLAANYVANALALVLLALVAVRLGATAGIRPGTLLLALATLFALPPFVGYAGQPMHYLVGAAANFLLVMAVAAMKREELRNPVTAGVIMALYAVGYDPYVFLAAFLLFFTTVRFVSRRADVVFVTIALAPPLVWHSFLRVSSQGQVSDDVRERFIYAVAVEWSAFFEAPIRQIVMPFMASHVGAVIATQQVIALVYWPLLLAGAAAVWILRPAVNEHHGSRLATLLVTVYLVEQLATAAFDWENNPRRALPVVLAFGFAYTWAADRLFDRKGWRYVFLGLFFVTAFLVMTDVSSRKNTLTHPYSGEPIRRGSKSVLRPVAEAGPEAAAAEATLIGRFEKVRRAPAPAFLFAQLFGSAMLLALLWILARTRLVPRVVPLVALLMIVLSAVRYVV